MKNIEQTIKMQYKQTKNSENHRQNNKKAIKTNEKQ